MPTQWDRRDLALVVRDALQFTGAHLEQLPEDAQARADELGPLVAVHDDIHFNVLYLRLDDGSSYRMTFIQTNPAMPTATRDGEGKRNRRREREPVTASA